MVVISNHHEALCCHDRAQSKGLRDLRGFIDDTVVKPDTLQQRACRGLQACRPEYVITIETLPDLVKGREHFFGSGHLKQLLVHAENVVRDADELLKATFQKSQKNSVQCRVRI